MWYNDSLIQKIINMDIFDLILYNINLGIRFSPDFIYYKFTKTTCDDVYNCPTNTSHTQKSNVTQTTTKSHKQSNQHNTHTGNTFHRIYALFEHLCI